MTPKIINWIKVEIKKDKNKSEVEKVDWQL